MDRGEAGPERGAAFDVAPAGMSHEAAAVDKTIYSALWQLEEA